MLRRFALLILVGLTGLLCAGCGGPSSGGSASFRVYTYNGASYWTNATLKGFAELGTYSCDPGVHPDTCIVNFQGVSTGATGYADIGTQALPAFWTVGALADSTCPSGASNYGQITTGGYLQLYCGQLNGAGASVTPASCTIVYVNGVQQGFCSPYLEITTSSPILPTSYALSSGTYSVQGGSEGGSQATASSSTQIRVSAPTTFGENVVVVTDPQTNQTLAAVMYVLHECMIQTGPYGTTQNCPY